MGSWQSRLLGHRLISAYCCLSTFCYFPTGLGARAALSLGTREPKWGKGVGKRVGMPPGGLERVGLREGVCSGQQETGWQWKGSVHNWPVVLESPTHCLVG